MGGVREAMDRLTEALNSRDADAVGGCFAPDAVEEDSLGRYEGREAIVESWRGMFQAFPDFRVDVRRTFESGDTAIDEWTFTGTHDGPLVMPTGETVPATGRRVELEGCDFGTVAGGLVTSHRAYFDSMALLTQLGLVPEEAAAG